MSNEIISIAHVHKAFREAEVLQDINVTFGKGKIYGIVGRNGSGKTVLLKCILGLMPVTSGEIRVLGKVIRTDGVSENIGAIIETPGFLPNYSGYKNLSLLAKINGRIGKKEILDALNKVGLDPSSRKHVRKYSLGMRQRLGIAQAIMESPELLILDEPFNGLDNDGVRDMHALFHQLRAEGRTILMASHNKSDIDELCDEVYAMDKGIMTRVR